MKFYDWLRGVLMKAASCPQKAASPGVAPPGPHCQGDDCCGDAKAPESFEVAPSSPCSPHGADAGSTDAPAPHTPASTYLSVSREDFDAALRLSWNMFMIIRMHGICVDFSEDTMMIMNQAAALAARETGQLH